MRTMGMGIFVAVYHSFRIRYLALMMRGMHPSDDDLVWASMQLKHSREILDRYLKGEA